MEYNSALKLKDFLTNGTAWMNLEGYNAVGNKSAIRR